MLPIVDSNWSPASQDAATDCHILRAIAVQTAMSNADVDSQLASLCQHAKTPGLGGLPNGIAAYLDITAADALKRIDEFIVSDRVLGVSVVLDAPSALDDSLIKPCIDLLASNQASVDISGDIDCIDTFLQKAKQVPQMNIICNISFCSRAGNRVTLRDWPSLISVLRDHDNVTVKITDSPTGAKGNYQSAVDQLSQAIQQLAGAMGITRIVLGSGATAARLPDDRSVWQYFDSSTRWASARERDHLFRENAVRIYRL